MSGTAPRQFPCDHRFIVVLCKHHTEAFLCYHAAGRHRSGSVRACVCVYHVCYLLWIYTYIYLKPSASFLNKDYCLYLESFAESNAAPWWLDTIIKSHKLTDLQMQRSSFPANSWETETNTIKSNNLNRIFQLHCSLILIDILELLNFIFNSVLCL